MKPSIIAVAGLLVLIAGKGGAFGDAGAASTDAITHANFNTDGSVARPMGYREWYHAGTRMKLDGENILDHLPINAPEMLETYVEPSAFEVYRKTGQWPDGTQLVKEFSVIKTGAGCDARTLSCSTPFGSGIFQAGYIGLGMMVKDAKRFPDHPGHWGFFNFGHRPPPYPASQHAQPMDQCQDCHSAIASDTDWVISKSHIGLSKSNADE